METKKIEKGLIYTKSIYEAIADDAKQHLDNLAHEDDRTTSDEYGIYYNALAGLLRAGVLCSRITGTDGFPEIRIVSGSKSYQCREDVIRTILAEEADYIISPYEDKFESYLDPVITYDIPDGSEGDSETGTPTNTKNKQEIRALKKAHRAELDKMKSQYESQIKDLKQQLSQKTATITVPLPDPAPVPPVPPAPAPAANTEPTETVVIKDPEVMGPILPIPEEPQIIMQPVADPELEKKIQGLEKDNGKLNQENGKLSQENTKLQTENKDQKQQIQLLNQQLKQKTQLLAEHDKYQYDPVYDHYYSDELPVIISSLESTKSDLIFKGIAIFGCVVGIAISAVTGFFQFL